MLYRRQLRDGLPARQETLVFKQEIQEVVERYREEHKEELPRMRRLKVTLESLREKLPKEPVEEYVQPGKHQERATTQPFQQPTPSL